MTQPGFLMMEARRRLAVRWAGAVCVQATLVVLCFADPAFFTTSRSVAPLCRASPLGPFFPNSFRSFHIGHILVILARSETFSLLFFVVLCDQ